MFFDVQSGDVNQPKAAFFISTPFTNATFNVFQDIISASNFRTVLVFSNIPPVMHSIIEYHVAEEEMKAFESYRMQILQWLEIKVLCKINHLLTAMNICLFPQGTYSRFGRDKLWRMECVGQQVNIIKLNNG